MAVMVMAGNLGWILLSILLNGGEVLLSGLQIP